MSSRSYLFAAFFLLACLSTLVIAETSEENESKVPPEDTENEAGEVDQEKLEYAKGSVCGYCEYCKFCELCNAECPCTTSARRPNCDMCKYCKYCYLCPAVCDTFCKPGGYVDKVTGAIISSLPFHDKDEINKDIDSMKDWIEKKKEEL